MKTKDFFTASQQSEIVQAIAKAESNTNAEIRVHIDSVCLGNPINAALKEFSRLQMEKTEARNGVLIYVAHRSRKCAILGDKGINDVVPEGFWDSCYSSMVEQFKCGNFSEGIIEAISKAGEQLKLYFPYKEGDINELPDEISFGK